MSTLINGTVLSDEIILNKQTSTLTLDTDNKYVDKDIQFYLTVQSGAAGAGSIEADVDVQSGGANNISSVIGTKSTTQPSGYYIKLEASGSGSPTISTAGWIDAGSMTPATATAVKYFPIAAASVTQNAPTIDEATGLVSATTTTTAGYTPALTTAASTLQLSTQSGKTVTPTESQQTAVAAGKYTTGNVLVGAISPSYVGSAIPKNSTSSLAVSGDTVTAPAGYYATDASASVAEGIVKSGSATISSVSVGYDSANDNFDITGTGNVSAPNIDKAGYISSSKGTKAPNDDGASVNASVSKIAGTTNITGTFTYKPSISKQSTPSGVVNAASGNATTTAPSSGVYVAVKATGGTNQITATPSISTAGYGEASHHGITNGTANVGADDSSVTYVPITTTSASVSGKNVTYGTGWITGATKSVADGATDYAVSSLPSGATSSGTISRGKYIKVGQGWHEDEYYLAQPNSGDKTISSAGTTNVDGYATATVAAGTVKATVSSNTAGEASMSAEGFTPLSSGTSAYYVTLSTSPGKVKAKAAGYTAGYVTSSTTDESSLTNVSVTGDGDKVYIPAGSTTMNNMSVASSTGIVTSTATITAGYQAASTPSKTLQLSTQAGTTITPAESEKTAVAAGKYTTGAVKVGAISSFYVGSAIARNDSESLSASAATVTAPAGYYAEDAIYTISSGSVTQNAPTINTSTGLVSANATNTAGYIAAGTTPDNTLQLSTQGAQTITPGTTAKEIPAGKYLTGKQTIAGDANLTAANIKKGVDIFGVTGSYTTVSGKTALTAAALRTGYAGFANGGSQINGSMPDTTITEGVTTVSGTTATRGTWSQTVGYTTARTIPYSKFGNTATSGHTYVDISSCEGTPVLKSNDYLYIDKGYTDDIKISLARLVPDASTVGADITSASMVEGYTAYNNDGKIVTGSMQTVASTDLTVSGKTVTIPVGYYTGASNATPVAVSVADGDYTPSVVSGGTNTAAAFTPKTTGTITNITTTTQPSGTDGTDYWTITPGGDKTTGKARAKATATIDTAGYIAAGSKTTSSYATWNITTNVNTGTTSYIPKAAIAGSSTNATATTTVAPGTVSISKQGVPSGVTQAASGDATTTAPTSGVYVAVKATAAANTTGTTSSISGSGSATVSAAGYAPSTLTGTVTVSGTATAKTSAKDSNMTYVPITTATPAFDGGTLSGGSTATGTNVTLSTTDNGMKVQTAYTAASTAVLYNGAVNGWVSKADNAQALAAQSKASTNGTAYYVTAVTMPKDKGFTVTTTADTALDTTSDLDVTNNAYRRVDITNKANGTVLVANSGTTSITSGSATAGTLTVNAYDNASTPALTGAQTIVSNGKWSMPTVNASGTYYGRVIVGAGTVAASVSSNTAGSASVAATGFTASSSATSYYVTLSTTAGSVKAKAAGGTAGYVTSSTTNETAATSVAVSGNGTKLYIPTTGVTASVSSNTGGSASMAATGFTASSSATSYYVTLSTTAGSVKAKAVGNGTGIVTSSTSNETAATSVAVSGNGNKLYIPAAAPTFKGGAVSGTATASSSTGATLSSTNNSGITVVAAASATRAKVQYNAAVNGYLSKAASADAYAASSATALTSTTYYLNGVTMATPSSGSRTFTITAPSGGTNHTYTFTQGADGRTTIKVDNTLTMAWNATDEALDFIYT